MTRTRLVAWIRTTVVISLVGLVLGLFASSASAQVPRPVRKGTKYSVKIDSSPQQAAIYLDDKQYGIVGYTPFSGKLVKGDYKLIVELQGFKTVEKQIRVDRKSREFFVVLEKAGGFIEVSDASDQNLKGAQIIVDGLGQGTVPGKIQVNEGRHAVELSKAGFQTFQTSVEVRAGQTITLAPVLKAAELPKGSLLIDADVDGATVEVDGRPIADAPPVVVDNLDEGPHIIVVSKAPADPWKQTVYVKAGQRTKVTAQLQASVAERSGGVIKVISNVEGADVYLDGSNVGKAPLELTKIQPGVHIVEVRMAGYAPREEKVTVVAGQAMVVKMDLDAKTAKGRIKIVTKEADADVFVDGAGVGKAPLVLDIEPGEHFVAVRKAGLAPFEQKITVELGKELSIIAELKPIGALRFLSNIEGAEVVLNGEVIGKTPFIREDLPIGDHVVTIRKAGFYDFEQTVRVEGGKLAIINAELRAINTGPTPEDIVRIRRGLASYGARTMPYGRFTVDASVGYPYWIEARATVGVIDQKLFGIDAHVGFRSLLTTWEFMGGARVRLVKSDPFALGAFATVIGGGGIDGRNEFSFQAGGMASILFNEFVTISARGFFDIWSDRLCASPAAGMTVSSSGPDVCTGMASAEDAARANALTGNDLYGRDNGVRFYTSLVVEAAVDRMFSFFLIFEGAPFQDQRAAHSKLFNGLLLSKDDPIYNGRIGITFKF